MSEIQSFEGEAGEQSVDVLQHREETVEAVMSVPFERVQQRTAEQIEDAPQRLEEIVEMVRTVEQMIHVFGRIGRGVLDPQVRVHQLIDEHL